MKRSREEAYVLRHRPLGEADLIVSLLTAGGSVVRTVAPSARRSRRRFGGSLEPLTRVVASWCEREGRELARLEQLELVRSFADLQADPEKLAACAVVAEVTEVYCREGQPDPRTFRLLGAVLDALGAGRPAAPVLRYFEYWMLRLQGLLPDAATCAGCGAAVTGREARVEGGHLWCSACAQGLGAAGVRWTAAARAFIEQASRKPPHEVEVSADAAGPGGPLETLLRGALERYAERRFQTYRHFHMWACGAPLRGAGA